MCYFLLQTLCFALFISFVLPCFFVCLVRVFGFVSGTATTLAGIAQGLPAYDPERIHHARVPVERLREITAELLAMPHEQRAAIGVMHPGRVDVIGAGSLIVERVLARTGAAEFVASEHDILDGIAWSLAVEAPASA